MAPISKISIEELSNNYEALLFDAFGVLIDHQGPLPGAAGMIQWLNRAKKPFFVVTNDASRDASELSAWYNSHGLDIGPDRVISSGSILQTCCDEHGLSGQEAVVLGPESSKRLVKQSGFTLSDWSTEQDFAALIICDEEGFPFPQAINHIITRLFSMWERSINPSLILVNPDYIYPKGSHQFGITAGCIAALIEAAVSARYPSRREPLFIKIGKPYSPIFDEAVRRANTRKVIMIGDQISTDIKGACNFGIDSALVPTGVSNLDPQTFSHVPTYIVETLGVFSS